MTISQKIEPFGNGNQMDFEDIFTVTDVPQGQFLAVTSNNAPPEGGTTRTMTVQCMDGGNWAPGGTCNANSGMYVRASGETSVAVKLLDVSGTEVASNTTNYS